MKSQYNLGCGKEFNMNHSFNGFICGVPNGWGTEKFCKPCMDKLRAKWAEEDSKRKKEVE